jgi:hypothetical protein
MEVFTSAAVAALIWKVMSVVKMATGRDLRGVLTQVLTWLTGVVSVMLMAQADVSDQITVWGNGVLSQLDGLSQVIAGLVIASVASAGYDFKKAFDNTDSSSEPALGSNGE